MKFILNVSFAPHFVALFDDQNQIIDQRVWHDFKAGSQHVWNFLDTHEIGTTKDLTFIGGISGPGGFSTLRVGGAIINALGFKFKCPVHQARADLVARSLIGNDDFVLNSFGNGVFVPKGRDLERMAAAAVAIKHKNQPLFVDWLPEDKKALFRPLTCDKDIIQTTFEVLLKTPERPTFLPDYEYPPVS